MKKIICMCCGHQIPAKEFKCICKKCGSPRTLFNNTGKCKVKGCDGEFTAKCPICEYEQSMTILLSKGSIAIRLMGGCCSGKTVYYTTMVNELNKIYDITPLDERTEQNYKSLFMYLSNSSMVPANPIEFKPNAWNMKINVKDNYELCIYDISADGLLTEKEVENFYFVNDTDYVFAFIDISSLASIRKYIDVQLLNANHCNSLYEDASQTLEMIVNYMHVAFDIPIGKKILKPVAVIFTKMDLVCNMDEISEIGKLKNFDNDSIEIERWLETIGETEFVSILNTNFNNYRLFTISCLSYKGQSEFEVKPRGVLNPFKWAMQNEGIDLI